jgi:hypothetical protein
MWTTRNKQSSEPHATMFQRLAIGSATQLFAGDAVAGGSFCPLIQFFRMSGDLTSLAWNSVSEMI